MANPQTESILGLRLISYYSDSSSSFLRTEQDSIGLGFLIGNSGSTTIGSPQSHTTSGVYDNIGNRFWLLPKNPEWNIYGSCNTANNIIFGGSGNRLYGNSMFNNFIAGAINSKIISGSNNYIFGISGEIKTNPDNINNGNNLLFGINNKIYGSNNILFGINNRISNTGVGHTGIVILGGQNNCTFSPIGEDITSINTVYNSSNKINNFYNDPGNYLNIINGFNNRIGGDYSAIYNGVNNIVYSSGTSIVGSSGLYISADYSFGTSITNSRVGGKNIFISNSDDSAINYEIKRDLISWDRYGFVKSETGEFIEDDIDIRLIDGAWTKQGLKSYVNAIGNCANHLVGSCTSLILDRNNSFINLFNGTSGINVNNANSTVINYQSYVGNNCEAFIMSKFLSTNPRDCVIPLGFVNNTFLHADGESNIAMSSVNSSVMGFGNNLSNTSGSFVFGESNNLAQGNNITLIGQRLNSSQAACFSYYGSVLLGTPMEGEYDLAITTGNSLRLSFENGIYVNTKSGFYINGKTFREKIIRDRNTLLDLALI